MREVDPPEADRLAFFMHEELLAIKRAVERIGLVRADIESILSGDEKRLLGVWGRSSEMHTPRIPERQLQAALRRNEELTGIRPRSLPAPL
jgi:hypothetical protein